MSTDPAIDSELRQRPGLRIPRHLGVIMDGNGRWARARGKPRTEGHIAGVKALRRLVELCMRYGVDHLTVFSFSSENWTRPRDEVNFIFGLLRRFVASDLEKLMRNNVQVRIIGSRQGLDESLQRLIAEVEAKTAANTGLQLVVAFNYGGKAEITEAMRSIARDVAAGRIAPDAITEATVEQALYTSGIPDPDIIIRTSGERRFSNFLLWQSAYSELIFVEENWPDFDESTFVRILEEYASRERRFGGIEAVT
ncbi:MAG: isoprenyl transferase [Devosia nanyangense]|jgi:undecaprenyl diphosphate synthase|uniref:Isoprenyl transferase n=1 Tax=Paradevosia shaoguanensis TaxID=1335043 RepID=A0AA41QL34_9HYPH|nr:isoprenyl transferase [Paradevosia shaoguanensis]MBI4047157.1 isoprenyl transferase [Devosia nanyangense]MCF1742358.1 isoprenyl transferase [Paradevosia shaoguanensis]MCI0126841.1 isoprenyl transferase [Paradevosia shaoguanensis]